jgi:heparan-alpha-glucosaminide N-acetyltransferase
MTQGERIHSIDIMKGIIIVLMLFVNALYLPGLIPWCPDYPSANATVNISGWFLIGFLFLMGMTVPFMISKKINNGFSSYEISRSIFGKSLILITIGVMMVNTARVDPELTGFSKYIWSILLFVAVFLVWLRYPDEDNNFFTVTGLRFLGLALLVFLVFKFRSGTFENGGTLITGWWEVPGLFGWGYLVVAFTYLALRNSIFGTVLVWLVFLLLNISAQLRLTGFMDPVRPFIGVITDGSIPFILLSGQITSLILKRFSERETQKTVTIILSAGTFSVITGVILMKYVITSQSCFNPGIELIVNGICMILFIFFHWLIDLKNSGRWLDFFKPAGENALTAYLFPFIIYNLIWLAGINIFFFRQYDVQLINIAGSGILAILMLLLSTIIIKLNIRLKI